MFTDQTLIIVNIVCMAAMLLIAAILCAATKFRGGAGYAALIIVATTIPVYIYNMSRTTGMWDTARWAIYPCSIANTLLMPLLWLFVRREAGERIKWKTLTVNSIPTIAMAAVTIAHLSSLDYDGMTAFLEADAAGHSPWLVDFNTGVLAIQAVVYFILIFRYIARQKRALCDNCSDADLLHLSWIKGLMIIFAVLYAVVAVGALSIPMCDVWLIPILNTLAMSYLAYHLIAFRTTVAPTVTLQPIDEGATTGLTIAEMEDCCRRIDAFLTETQAYKRVDLSLHQLADETGMAAKTISRSINGFWNRNFFQVINRMRIDEAKRLLLELDRTSYNIDSIYAECGFRSRSTFFLAFARIEGTSPAEWLKKHDRAK